MHQNVHRAPRPVACMKAPRHVWCYGQAWADSIYVISSRTCTKCGIRQDITNRPVHDRIEPAGPRTRADLSGYQSGQAMPLRSWRIIRAYFPKPTGPDIEHEVYVK